MSISSTPKMTTIENFFLIFFFFLNSEMFKPVVTFSLDDIVLLVLYAGVSLSAMENAH